MVKKVISLALRLAAHRGVHPDIDKLSPEEAMPALAVAEEERTMKWEAVLLLGTDRRSLRLVHGTKACSTCSASLLVNRSRVAGRKQAKPSAGHDVISTW